MSLLSSPAAATRSSRQSYLRTLLVLGRVSNLPTVWSNCLAGWWLAGGGEFYKLVLLLCGGTLLYTGGMFLNDAFDAQFDQQHRLERPIPSGAISVTAVWQWGLAWLGLGLGCLFPLGTVTAVFASLLASCILIYDMIHKIFAVSPVLMAACRFFLVLLAASAAASGVTGLSIWSAFVLGAYIVGLSYLARKESIKGPLRYWPCLFLTAPMVLGLIVNRGPYQVKGWILCGLLLAWVIVFLRYAYWTSQPHIGRSVSGLLAGIVLVDLLAVGADTVGHTLSLLALFVLALLFQRFIPAT